MFVSVLMCESNVSEDLYETTLLLKSAIGKTVNDKIQQEVAVSHEMCRTAVTAVCCWDQDMKAWGKGKQAR